MKGLTKIKPDTWRRKTKRTLLSFVIVILVEYLWLGFSYTTAFYLIYVECFKMKSCSIYHVVDGKGCCSLGIKLR